MQFDGRGQSGCNWQAGLETGCSMQGDRARQVALKQGVRGRRRQGAAGGAWRSGCSRGAVWIQNCLARNQHNASISTMSGPFMSAKEGSCTGK